MSTPPHDEAPPAEPVPVEELEAPRVAVFLDMDHTLIDGNSAYLYMKHLRRQGRVSFLELAQSLWWLAQYKLNVIDMPSVSRRAFAKLAGDEEAAVLRGNEGWFERWVRPLVFPAGRELIASHRGRGHLPVIITASTLYATHPVARHLGIDHVVCTRMEVASGRFTGRYHEPVCYGEGKVHWAEHFCAERGLALRESWFYTDSYSDLPLLQAVANPVVVNPDLKLAAHARRAGWPMLRFQRRRRAG